MWNNYLECKWFKKLFKLCLIVIWAQNEESFLFALWLDRFFFVIFICPYKLFIVFFVIDMNDTLDFPDMHDFLPSFQDCNRFLKLVQTYHKLIFWVLCLLLLGFKFVQNGSIINQVTISFWELLGQVRIKNRESEIHIIDWQWVDRIKFVEWTVLISQKLIVLCQIRLIFNDIRA